MQRLRATLVALTTALMLILVAACQSGGAPSQDTDDGGGDAAAADLNAQLRLATLQQGSTWHAYGALFADQWREEYPGVQVQVLPFAGGVANLDLVAEGQAELGLTFSSIANWAHTGRVGFEEPLEDIRGMIGAFDQYYVGIVTRADYPAETLSDVDEQQLPLRLYTLTPGSAGEFMARAALEAHGLSYDTIREYGGSVEQTSFDVITSAFADGNADMMIQVITANHPATTEIATSNDIKLMPVQEDVHAGLEELGVGYSEIPAGSFRGQDEAVPALALSTLLVTRADQPDDLIRALTQSLVENAEGLAEQNAALADFDPAEGVSDEAMTIPLHPGAEAYLEEAGLLD